MLIFSLLHFIGPPSHQEASPEHWVFASTGIEALRSHLPYLDHVGKPYDQWKPYTTIEGDTLLFNPHRSYILEFSVDYWLASQMFPFPIAVP